MQKIFLFFSGSRGMNSPINCFSFKAVSMAETYSIGTKTKGELPWFSAHVDLSSWVSNTAFVGGNQLYTVFIVIFTMQFMRFRTLSLHSYVYPAVYSKYMPVLKQSYSRRPDALIHLLMNLHTLERMVRVFIKGLFARLS